MKKFVSFIEGMTMIIIGIILWQLLMAACEPSTKKPEEKVVESEKTIITINGCEYTLTHKGNCKNHK